MNIFVDKTRHNKAILESFGYEIVPEVWDSAAGAIIIAVELGNSRLIQVGYPSGKPKTIYTISDTHVLALLHSLI